ncbi:DUF3140 domain-containing protein [Georgenia sp. SUBG003]|uniref:DUF3140 domain-containing protein n=1 Tax=Georgenia sp. SUBG003 TaxID=1497974 RepID=UPI003AB5BF9C
MARLRRRPRPSTVPEVPGYRLETLLRKKKGDLNEDDEAHMRKVVGYVHRHLAQRPDGDVERTRWRYSPDELGDTTHSRTDPADDAGAPAGMRTAQRRWAVREMHRTRPSGRGGFGCWGGLLLPLESTAPADPALTTIGTPTLWAVTIGFVLALLVLDFLVTRRPHEVSMKEAVGWSVFYIALPLAFGGWIWARYGSTTGVEYLTGYLVEKSLSVDNLFVFMLLLSAFAVRPSCSSACCCSESWARWCCAGSSSRWGRRSWPTSAGPSCSSGRSSW